MENLQSGNATPIRVVVVMEGGIVQDIIADMPVSVTVIDYDIEGHDPISDETYAIQQQDGSFEPAYRSAPSAIIDAGRIDQLENAALYFDYDKSADDLVKRWMNCRVETPWPAREQRVLWRASFALDGCPFELSFLVPVTSIEAAQDIAARCLQEIWPDQVEKLDQSFLAGQAVLA